MLGSILSLYSSRFFTYQAFPLASESCLSYQSFSSEGLKSPSVQVWTFRGTLTSWENSTSRVSPEISGERILPRRKGWEKSPVEGKSFCLQPALSARSPELQHAHPGAQFSWEMQPRSLCQTPSRARRQREKTGQAFHCRWRAGGVGAGMITGTKTSFRLRHGVCWGKVKQGGDRFAALVKVGKQ